MHSASNGDNGSSLARYLEAPACYLEINVIPADDLMWFFRYSRYRPIGEDQSRP
jgi:hypothetical protein